MFIRPEFLHAAATAAMMTAVGWTATLAAWRLLPHETASARLATTWLFSAVLQVGIFLSLSAAHRFRVPYMLAATASLCLASHVAWARRTVPVVAADAANAAALWRALGAWRVAAVVVVAPSLLRLARQAVAPPLAWDALTYHLPRAAQWIRSGSFVPLDGPDASAYYNHYPPYGEVFFAWGLSAFHSDAALFMVGAWMWAGVWIGAYALARSLGAERTPSLAAAAACASTPAIASLIAANYVDNVLVAMLLCGLALTFRMLGSWRVGPAIASGVAVGLMLGTKSTGVPVAAALAATILVALSGRLAVVRLRTAAVAALAACALAVPPLAVDYVQTGNPFYPVGISAPPIVEWRGDALFTETHREGSISAATVLGRLFSPYRESDGYDQLGFGPASFLLVILAALGMSRVKTLRLPHVVAGLAGVVVAITVPTFLPSMRALWGLWAPVSPRLVAGALGLVAAMAACSGASPLLWAAALANAVQSVPHGIGPSEWSALREAVPWLSIAAIATAALAQISRVRVFQRAIAVVAIWTALIPVLAGTRAKYRTPIYAEAAAQLAFDVHTLSREPAGAWPLWRQLDTMPGTRLALTGGFVAAGHTWYRFPLYGSQLQHDVAYVPVTSDGSLVSYRDPGFVAHACEACWASRLYRRSIALVVGLTPHPPEVEWARRAPGRFTPLADTGTAAAFLVETDPTFVGPAGNERIRPR